jgi:hypothetical protein
LDAERERRDWWKSALAMAPAFVVLSISRPWIAEQLEISLSAAGWLKWTIAALLALLAGVVLARIQGRAAGTPSKDRDQAV